MTTLQLPGGFQLPVQHGQCLLEDLGLVEFTRDEWWKGYWQRLQRHVRDFAGRPGDEKVVLSVPVSTPVCCEPTLFAMFLC